jgi:hypothetical protein
MLSNAHVQRGECICACPKTSTFFKRILQLTPSIPNPTTTGLSNAAALGRHIQTGLSMMNRQQIQVRTHVPTVPSDREFFTLRIYFGPQALQWHVMLQQEGQQGPAARICIM